MIKEELFFLYLIPADELNDEELDEENDATADDEPVSN